MGQRLVCGTVKSVAVVFAGLSNRPCMLFRCVLLTCHKCRQCRLCVPGTSTQWGLPWCPGAGIVFMHSVSVTQICPVCTVHFILPCWEVLTPFLFCSRRCCCVQSCGRKTNSPPVAHWRVCISQACMHWAGLANTMYKHVRWCAEHNGPRRDAVVTHLEVIMPGSDHAKKMHIDTFITNVNLVM